MIIYGMKKDQFILIKEKIKNKEDIEILDDTDILNKINKKDSSEKSEFEDLLEIGE